MKQIEEGMIRTSFDRAFRGIGGQITVEGESGEFAYRHPLVGGMVQVHSRENTATWALVGFFRQAQIAIKAVGQQCDVSQPMVDGWDAIYVNVNERQRYQSDHAGEVNFQDVDWS